MRHCSIARWRRYSFSSGILLLRTLFLGMGSSQRASGEVTERFPELVAPNRSIPFE
jgi:hypothetical protein